MQQLQEIYNHYIDELEKVQSAASPLAGIFGTGGGPKDHPCHEGFFDRVGQWVETFMSGEPEEEAIAEAARYILIAGAAHKDQPSYWFCSAAQAHVKALIPQLSQAHCEALRQEYDSLYPSVQRMPLNREIYALLCTHAGSIPPKKVFFHFLRK